MQSKTSFFNVTLFKKTIMRFWPIWGVLCIVGALLPLITFVTQANSGKVMTFGDVEEFYYSVCTYAVPAISFVYAIVSAVCVWDYLYSHRSTVFYHSLPVSRTALFITQFLAGIVIMIIPYATTAILFSIEFLVWGAFSIKATLVTILCVLAMSFIFFAIATFFAHLTGFLPALPILYVVFNFIFILIEYIVELLMSSFLLGISNSYKGKLTFLSPVVKLYQGLCVSREVDEVYVDHGYGGYLTNETIGATLNGCSIILWYTLAALIITVIAFLLYKNRKSESAGKVVTLEIVKHVIHVVASFVGAITGGICLATLLDKEKYANVVTVCIVFVGIVAFFIIKMLIERTAKVFNKNTALGCVALSVVYIVMCVLINVDAFGVEAHIPNKSDVKMLTISADGYYFIFTPGEDDTLYDSAVKLQNELINDKERLRTIDRYSYESDVDDEYQTNVWYTYILNNGKQVERSYYIPIIKNGTDVISKAYNDLVTNPEIIKRILHVGDSYEIISADGHFDNYTAGDYRSFSLQPEQYETIREALLADAEAGLWKPLSRPKYEVYDDVECTLAVNLYFERNTGKSGDFASYEYDSVYANVRPEMTNTLKALLELGCIDEEVLEIIK